MLDYGRDPGESVIQNNLGGTMAAGTKQKGAKMTRVIGEEAATVIGLRIRSRGQLLQGRDRFRVLPAWPHLMY